MPTKHNGRSGPAELLALFSDKTVEEAEQLLADKALKRVARSEHFATATVVTGQGSFAPLASLNPATFSSLSHCDCQEGEPQKSPAHDVIDALTSGQSNGSQNNGTKNDGSRDSLPSDSGSARLIGSEPQCAHLAAVLLYASSMPANSMAEPEHRRLGPLSPQQREIFLKMERAQQAIPPAANKVPVKKQPHPETQAFLQLSSQVRDRLKGAPEGKQAAFLGLVLSFYDSLHVLAPSFSSQLVHPRYLALQVDPIAGAIRRGFAEVVTRDWAESGLTWGMTESFYPESVVQAQQYALAEGILQALLAPAPSPQLVDLVEQDPDERVFDALRALAKQGAAAPRMILSWRVSISPGRWRLNPYAHKLTKSGKWSSGARVSRLDPDQHELLPQDELAAARESDPLGMLHALVGHPRVHLEDGLDVCYRVEKAELSLRTEENGRAYLVEPVLGGILLSSDQGIVGTHYAAVIDDARQTLLVARLDNASRRFLAQRGKHPLRVTKAKSGDLLSTLSPLETQMEMDHAPSLRGEQRASDNRAVARFAFLGAQYSLVILVEPLGAGLAVQPGRGVMTLSRTMDGKRVYTTRDATAEHHIAAAVWAALSLPQRQESDDYAVRALGTEQALDLLVKLQSIQADLPVRIEWPKQTPRVGAFASFSQMKVKAGGEYDWLNQNSTVTVDEHKIQLATVLDAVRQGARYLELDDGNFIHIADALREQLQQLEAARSRQATPAGDIATALVLDQLEALGAEVDFGKELRDLVVRIKTAREVTHPVPAELRATLRPYQHEGYEWLMKLASWGIGGVLADDMGLGKTVQAIALLLARHRQGPALVVAPTSVCANWQRELAAFAPTLSVAMVTEVSSAAADVVIASYGWLARNQESLKERSFATAIFDEAQALKNPVSQRAHAAREIKAQLKFALSGTPIENRLSELWSLFRIVAPGLLGSQETFVQRFATPIETHKNAVARKLLGQVIAPFVLRRKKEIVARDLPDKTVIDVRVDLEPQEWHLYDALRVAKIEALESKKNPLTAQQRRIQLLAALTELRLAANHPRFAHAESLLESSKLNELMRLMTELKNNGHRALVFSQFPSFLAFVTRAFDQAGLTYQYLDGQTPKAERQARINAFEGGMGDAFVLSLLAGGTGINLTSADYVIILDPWWNPAVEDQAIGRAHRIGQRFPVTVYRLFAKGTIEEKILAMQANKRELADAVLENASSAPSSVSADELFSLLTAG